MKLKVGDTVAFAKSFLRNIHAKATDDIWRERGTIVAIKEYGRSIPVIAYVRGFQTTSEDGLAHVNVNNLAVVGSLRFAEDVDQNGKEVSRNYEVRK